jgi:hypothetical protein
VRSLADGRVLSWSPAQTCNIWDGATGAPLRVFATPHGWRDDEAAVVANLRPHARAHQHALHLGFRVAAARDELAVFVADRQLRFCRFVPVSWRTA